MLLDGMNPATEIDVLVARFVGGQSFMEFWKSFMDCYAAFDDSVLSPGERVRFAQL